jgi:hypothetical protein
VRRLVARAAVAAFCAISLSGCVDSAGPILPDAKPLFGERLRLQFYTLHKGFADEPEQASFKWDGARYVHAGGAMSDVTAFTVHPFEANSYIIQSAAAKRPHIVEYAVAHKLAEGVYQVIAIDQDDANRATGARNLEAGGRFTLPGHDTKTIVRLCACHCRTAQG